MTTEEQLDEILKLLLKSTLENKALSFEYIKSEFKYDDNLQLQPLLNYLQSEGLIDCTNSLRDGHGNINISNIVKQQVDGNNYYITVKGRLFEGFIKQIERKNRIDWVTLAIVFGATLTGIYYTFYLVYEVIKILNNCH